MMGQGYQFTCHLIFCNNVDIRPISAACAYALLHTPYKLPRISRAIELDCGLPPVVNNTRAVYTSTLLDSTVKYQCAENFYMAGDNDNVTCNADGSWGALLPECEGRYMYSRDTALCCRNRGSIIAKSVQYLYQVN